MIPRLFAVRIGSNGRQEFIERPSNIGLRFSMPGGMKKFTVEMRAMNKWDALARKSSHHGQRMLVVDGLLGRPIAQGEIGEVQPDGRFVKYVCGTPWTIQHNATFDKTDYAPTETISEVIKNTLTVATFGISSDHSNIDSNTTTIDGYKVGEILGSYPQEVIEAMIELGDGSGNIWDYWLEPGPLNGAVASLPIPYYKQRVVYGTPDFFVGRVNLVKGQEGASHIWERRTVTHVRYGYLQGTIDQNNPMDINDGTANFKQDGVKVGDKAYNLTTGEVGEVTAISIDGTSLEADIPGAWSIGDSYSIKLGGSRVVATSTVSVSGATREVLEDRGELNLAQAQLLADARTQIYSEAINQQAIIIGSRYIQGRYGSKQPLWRVLMGGRYVAGQDIDIKPYTNSTQVAFFVTAGDYSYKDNRLRLVLERPDDRLDVLLRRAKIARAEAISTR